MGDTRGPNGLSQIAFWGLECFLLQIDVAEIVGHEGDELDAFVDFLDAEFLAGERG